MKRVLAVMVLAMFFLSGCLGAIDNVSEDDFDLIELPDGWGDLTQRSIGSPHLTGYATCAELEDALKQSLEQEMRVELLQAVEEQYFYGWGWMEDDIAMDAEMAADGGSNSATPQTRTAGEDFSGTNNQEQGVDEADFVKTDGHHIYYLNGQTLHVIAVPEFGDLDLVANMTVEGSPQAMLLNGDRLVVISSVSAWNLRSADPLSQAMGWGGDYGSWRTSTLTKFTVLDMDDRSAPEVERELYIEGWYSTAREVNGSIRAVTHAWMDIPGLDTWLELPEGYYRLDYDDPLRRQLREQAAWEAIERNREIIDGLALEDLLPQVHERAATTITTHHMSDGECADFSAPEEGMNRGFTSIFTLDLATPTLEFEADHIVGNSPLVYASEDVLIVAEPSFAGWWFWGNDDLDESTNLHTFDISNPGTTLYTGSGRVNGTVLDQFSLSEHEGIVRVATTTGQWGRWWMDDPEPMVSHVVTLERAADLETGEQILRQIGHVGGLAEGERIWSARFTDDMAYVVTFEQIDPLWTIDLSDPTNPTVLGELEVPGVSTYIHPMSEGMLLTIGLAPANEDGTGLDWSTTRIQTFDVSDPTTPTQNDHLDLAPVENPGEGGWSWGWSEATYEHKAFQYWAPKGLLAVPLSTYRYNSWTDASGGHHWSYEYVSKLMLVEVNETSGELSVYGEVDHSLFFDAEDGRWWGGDTQIRRSIFMGDFVVALSAGGVTATNLSTLNRSASVELDRQWPEYHDIWAEEVEEEEAKSDGSEGKEDDREGKDDGGKSSSDESDRPDDDTSDGEDSDRPDDDAGAAPDADRQ